VGHKATIVRQVNASQVHFEAVNIDHDCVVFFVSWKALMETLSLSRNVVLYVLMTCSGVGITVTG